MSTGRSERSWSSNSLGNAELVTHSSLQLIKSSSRIVGATKLNPLKSSWAAADGGTAGESWNNNTSHLELQLFNKWINHSSKYSDIRNPLFN